jgi:heat shock protein HspQ
MTRKSWMLIGFALALAVLYAAFFAHWLKPGTIAIYHVTRPSGYAMQTRREVPAPPITFGLERDYELTEIKAVSLAEWQTNHNVLPVWHLVADADPAPVKTFVYGQHLHGMKPAVPGAQPQPLQPNVVYRLFLTAGRARGQHDFKLGGSAPEAQ